MSVTIDLQVNLTSVICKVLESVIRQNMKAKKLFSDKQFGFVSGRSTVLKLTHIIDH